jgi:hypothetical protein
MDRQTLGRRYVRRPIHSGCCGPLVHRPASAMNAGAVKASVVEAFIIATTLVGANNTASQGPSPSRGGRAEPPLVIWDLSLKQSQ